MTATSMKHTLSALRGPRLGVALATLTGVLLSGCDYEPGTRPLEWKLDETTVTTVSDVGGNPAQLNGALGMLFGNPQEPGFFQTEQMLNDEFYPNRGWADLGEQEAEAILKDNRSRRFKWQLEMIRDGRFAEVTKPLYAEDLWQAWNDEFSDLWIAPEAEEEGEPAKLADPAADHPDPYRHFRIDPEAESATWQQEAEALWLTWYPTMKESADIYRQQCVHCHGVEGAGDGPTAPYLEPRPRDYRQGKFKRVAVDRNMRPRRADLLTILEQGITFTAMPSFDRFGRGELEGLIDYIMLLAVRGETESLTALTVTDNDGLMPIAAVQENYGIVWKKWLEADDYYVAGDLTVPTPEDVTPERIAHGRELFLGATAACSTCHGTDARGANSSDEGLAFWEPAKDDEGNEILTTNEDGDEVPLMVIKPDEWGNPSNPRNLHTGIFRFGGRPIDLYRRVKYGISGAIMPAASAELSDDDLWDIVFYVKSVAEQYDIARVTEGNKARQAAERAAADQGHGHDEGGHEEDGHGEGEAHSEESGEHGGEGDDH